MGEGWVGRRRAGPSSNPVPRQLISRITFVRPVTGARPSSNYKPLKVEAR